MINHLAFLRERDNLWVAVIFIIAAYLSLFNLGNAPLWHDEVAIAFGAKNVLLEGVGIYDGWNGRNLYTKGQDTDVLRSYDFKMIAFPPWTVLPSALGVYLFGANEVGVRFFHALLGVGALFIFWLLLRLEFPQRPRLRVLAFAMFALLPQTILFFRYGRYAADAMFFALLLFYCYRLYIGPGGRLWHLTVAALAVILGFLNHFAIGGAFTLALAVWHLIYHARQTRRRQWIEMLIAAVLSGGICLFYLLAVGVIGGDEKLEFADYVYEYTWSQRTATFIFYNFRELIQLGWLPLWVALWLILFAVFSLIKLKKIPQTAHPDSLTDLLIIRWGMLIALFLIFSALLVFHMLGKYPLADSRYLVAILPFTSFIIAAFIESLWRFTEQRWSSLAGIFLALPLLVLALASNALSYPFIYPNRYTHETLRWIAPSLIAEIHRSYGGYQREIVDFLARQARQDDTIHVNIWNDQLVFQFYLSDKLIFCCMLDRETSPLSEDRVRALGAPLYKGDTRPTWLLQIRGGKLYLEDYELVYTTAHYAYPTQRPELEFHAHAPQPGKGAYIYRRID